MKGRMWLLTLRLLSSTALTSACRLRLILVNTSFSAAQADESVSLSPIASIFSISFLTFSFSLSDMAIAPGLWLLARILAAAGE